MSDWQPQIVKIEKIEKHFDADSLDIATVLGDYPVIVKRGEYKVGDLAGYIPIDSIVPDTNQFYFLCPKSYEKYEENGEVKQRQVGNKYELGSVPEKYRIIKAKKIRGVYSQGMLVELPDPPPNTWPDSCYQVWRAGESIVDLLGLKKWDEEEEENIPAFKMRGSNAEPTPKHFSIPYYDIESIRKYLPCVENEKDIILFEKLNGSNSSYIHDGEKLYAKSRNWFKKFDEDDPWHEAAIRFNLKEKLFKYPMLVFFAELVNQVKNFRYQTNIIDGKLMTNLYFFDIYNTKTMRYIDFDEFETIIKDLELPMAPVLYRGPWTSKEEIYNFAEGKSSLNDKVIREGWVLRLGKERFEPRTNGRCQFKLISEGYNLNK